MRFVFGVYFRLISVQFRSQLQYRLPFLMNVLATAMITTLGFASIAFVLQRFGGIGGWRLAEVAFLFGIVEAAFGTMDMIFSGFDPAIFGRQVRMGKFDQIMLRPVNLTLQILGSDFPMHRMGRITQGFLVLGLAISWLQVDWTLLKILLIPITFISLVCFFGGLFIAGATISFWTVESIEVINILTYGGSEMMSYPMHIYQDGMRKFFTFIIPAIFLNYYPALYILDKPDPFHMPAFAPLLSPIAGIGILAAALVFWNFGIRHYQSTGT